MSDGQIEYLPFDDPRLGRHVRHHPGNRDYPAPRRATEVQDVRWRNHSRRKLFQANVGACFPAGTFVRMADGSHKAIEDVDLLDEVVTAEGRTGRVVRLMVRPASELVRVRVVGHNRLLCTPEHPLLTQRGYVAASDVTTEDRVAATRYLPSGQDALWPDEISPHRRFKGVVEGIVRTGGVDTKVSRVPEVLGLTPALGRLVGLYAAEGHTSDAKVVWTFSSAEEETLVAETVSLLKDVLGAEARLQYRPQNAINVVLYGKHWQILFNRLVPGTSRHGDKHLSGHVTDAPAPFLEALLGGWLDGDGHRRRTQVEGISVSKRLALDMHAIATGLGRRPTFSHTMRIINKAARTRQDRWSVSLAEGAGDNVQPQDDHAVWRKVRRVEHLAFAGWVYNLEVEGDQSYVADGVGVHNCTGFTGAQALNSDPYRAARRARGLGLCTNDDGFAFYSGATARDVWQGTWPPTDTGSSGLAVAQELLARGEITEYRWAFGYDHGVAALAEGPLMQGTWWTEGMFDTDRNGQVRPTGRDAGGHEYLWIGLEVRSKREPSKNRSWFLNHWEDEAAGRLWGVDTRGRGPGGGYFWMTAQDHRDLLERDGDLVQLVVG